MKSQTYWKNTITKSHTRQMLQKDTIIDDTEYHQQVQQNHQEQEHICSLQQTQNNTTIKIKVCQQYKSKYRPYT